MRRLQWYTRHLLRQDSRRQVPRGALPGPVCMCAAAVPPQPAMCQPPDSQHHASPQAEERRLRSMMDDTSGRPKFNSPTNADGERCGCGAMRVLKAQLHPGRSLQRVQITPICAGTPPDFLRREPPPTAREAEVAAEVAAAVNPGTLAVLFRMFCAARQGCSRERAFLAAASPFCRRPLGHGAGRQHRGRHATAPAGNDAGGRLPAAQRRAGSSKAPVPGR